MTTKNKELLYLFYSTGLFRAIPASLTDDANIFGLPFAAVLWVSCWFDPLENRAKLFKYVEFTQKCLELCKEKDSKLSLIHLAVIYNCSPVQECVQLLLQAGADLNSLLPLGQTATTETLIAILQETQKEFISFRDLQVFCADLKGITAVGLAVLFKNVEYLQILAHSGADTLLV